MYSRIGTQRETDNSLNRSGKLLERFILNRVHHKAKSSVFISYSIIFISKPGSTY
jgi:hypothetical protein